MPRKVQKSLLIRGSEFILTLKLHSHDTESLTVEAMHKLTQICWRGVFNVQTITRLTNAAGSAKSFSSVTAMLRAAILQTSRSVSLDLLKPEEIATMGKSAGMKIRASSMYVPSLTVLIPFWQIFLPMLM
ncbi:hypothetical protein RvY_10932 [Ramazzottius varieornatus]|uniref:Uncharacterized protein n=1 Tax=Ramazzottius varieornatus TaxID=947166 RepID=A0A1D1VJU9_RAMVA|nr:hypothetical protein RvY_10932 [Ramazzottius varieornatus]